MRSHPRRGHHLGVGLAIFLLLAAFSRPAEATGWSPEIEVTLIGVAQIEPANNYSENTRLRIRLLYPDQHAQAGQVARNLPGAILVAEHVTWTRIYDGRHGATRLPLRLPAVPGEWEIVVKSLARYTIPDQRFAPIHRIEIHYDGVVARVRIPQWIDSDGNGRTDWLEMRISDLLARMMATDVPEVAAVVRAFGAWRESVRMECGGLENDGSDTVRISPACVRREGSNDHRLNTNQELTATVLHEARHVWQKQQGLFESGVDGFRLMGGERYQRNRETAFGQAMAVYVQGDEQDRYLEADAEDFAMRFKSLFP